MSKISELQDVSKTKEIVDKLKKGLDAEYYLVASGSTRAKKIRI